MLYGFVIAVVFTNNLVLLFENEAVCYSKYWTCGWKSKPQDQKPSSNISNYSAYPMSKPKLKIVLNVLFHGQLRSSKKTWTLSSFPTLLFFCYSQPFNLSVWFAVYLERVFIWLSLFPCFYKQKLFKLTSVLQQ